MTNTMHSFFDTVDFLKHWTSFKLFGKDSSLIKYNFRNDVSMLFMCLRFHNRHSDTVKFINKDITATELRQIFDSNEYHRVDIDCISYMSKDCIKMIEEFIDIYCQDENKSMCVVLLHKKHNKQIIEVFGDNYDGKGICSSDYYYVK